jgi:uncharacterized protein YydD (DUF2326 family)
MGLEQAHSAGISISFLLSQKIMFINSYLGKQMMPEESMTHLSLGQARVESFQTNNSLPSADEEIPNSNINKVKEILFGDQSREYERRFVRLEDRLTRECNHLREDTHQQFEALKQYIQQEISGLAAALKSEQIQRDEVLEGMDEAFKIITRTLEQRVEQLEVETSQRQRELRQQLLEQSKMLDDEIRQKYQEILAILERRTQELRAEKADRSTLASLFRDLALRVNNQDISDNI